MKTLSLTVNGICYSADCSLGATLAEYFTVLGVEFASSRLMSDGQRCFCPDLELAHRWQNRVLTTDVPSSQLVETPALLANDLLEMLAGTGT